DFNNQFVLPEHEVWAWNVVYTVTGSYYGTQSDAAEQSATCLADIGPLDFALQSAAVLKTFPNCDVLGDLTPDNIDLFTLEADKCRAMSQIFSEHHDAIAAALSQLIQSDDPKIQAAELLQLWQAPLQSAMNQGIAQFKRGKRIQTIEYSEDKA
ncbi:MAG: hypothetical protein IGR76_15725, partial [Synechococcales cyanobacterium T60_A2020_003]|nr:hypothetical protein [Synechococcales cyanobacterium T60_A2020_003]